MIVAPEDPGKITPPVLTTANVASELILICWVFVLPMARPLFLGWAKPPIQGLFPPSKCLVFAYTFAMLAASPAQRWPLAVSATVGGRLWEPLPLWDSIMMDGVYVLLMYQHHKANEWYILYIYI